MKLVRTLWVSSIYTQNARAFKGVPVLRVPAVSTAGNLGSGKDSVISARGTYGNAGDSVLSAPGTLGTG